MVCPHLWATNTTYVLQEYFIFFEYKQLGERAILIRSNRIMYILLPSVVSNILKKSVIQYSLSSQNNEDNEFTAI